MKSYKKAFSLVEVLVAISILVGSTVSVTFLVSNAIKTATSTRSNLIAAQLAQEGVEIIRRLRDENWINGVAFNDLEGTHRVDWISGSLPVSGNLPLRFHPNQGYSYSAISGDVVTPFTRLITVSSPNSRELQIEVEVTWTDREAVKSFIVEDHLFDWL